MSHSARQEKKRSGAKRKRDIEKKSDESIWPANHEKYSQRDRENEKSRAEYSNRERGKYLSHRRHANWGFAFLKTVHYGTKPSDFETLTIDFSTSEGVSEVSERANE